MVLQLSDRRALLEVAVNASLAQQQGGVVGIVNVCPIRQPGHFEPHRTVVGGHDGSHGIFAGDRQPTVADRSGAEKRVMALSAQADCLERQIAVVTAQHKV
jgi:hypothetical protein